MISHIRLIDDGKGYASRKNDKGEPENKTLFKNVVERTFEFFPDRINILFGPNQCGKTTVLRAIAHSIGIIDGWPKIFKYISKESTYEEKLSIGDIESVIGASGKHGGYKLCKDPSEYSIGEIIELMEGTFAPVACLEKNPKDCPRANKCKTLPMWKEFYELEKDFFYGKKLSDLI